LASLPEKMSQIIQKTLEKMGVEIYTNQRVAEVNGKELVTESGLVIPADLKIWAAGIKAASVLKQLDGLEVNHLNQLLITSTLQTTLDKDIFAFGDCAACPQSKDNKQLVPPRAQAAHQQAMLLSRSIKRRLKGKSLLLFHYRDYGSLITLSKRNTVGNLMGALRKSLFIEGKLARLTYLAIYKKHQIALHGFWHVFLMTLAELIQRRVKPKLKLH
jgi:NADH dehydrogenase